MVEGVVPQPEERIQFFRQQGIYRDRTLADMVIDGAARWGDRTALIFENERITYAELLRRVNRLAHGLLALGCQPGDRLVVQLPNVPEFVYVYFACHRIGAVPVLALPPHRQAEIAYFIQHATARFYVVPDTWRGFNYRQLVGEVRPQAPSLEHVLVTGSAGPGLISLAELMASQPDTDVDGRLAARRPHPGALALLLLSGGTTGLPKLIPRCHYDYDYHSVATGQLFRFNQQTVTMPVSPLAHNFALATPGLQATILAGGTVVLTPATDAATVFSLVEKHRVTFVSTVPALAIQWLNDPAHRRHDLRSWRFLVTGGQKFNPEPAAQVQERLGCELHQCLGMGEGLLVFTRPGDDAYTRYETVGRPVSPYDEVLVVDDDGNPVPVGEPGELWTRGPYTIRGYYRAPEHNAVAFTPDGYYKTGDVVRLDAAGRLTVLGRKKDMINRGGEKISAEEIENLLLSHPQIANAAVVAMPCPIMGERACAYLVLREAGLDLQAVIQFLLDKGIAKFKLPERLEVVDSLPLTSVGKINKRALREDIVARIAAG